jgi:hypothetical protein
MNEILDTGYCVSGVSHMGGRRGVIKGTTSKQDIDRDYPYQVELKLPSGGFRGFDRMYAFCRDVKFKVYPTRRGLEFLTRWCFQHWPLAESFQTQFGGQKINIKIIPTLNKNGVPSTGAPVRDETID